MIAAAMLLLHLSYSYSTLNYHFYLLLFFGLLLLVRLELSRRQRGVERAQQVAVERVEPRQQRAALRRQPDA